MTAINPNSGAPTSARQRRSLSLAQQTTAIFVVATAALFLLMQPHLTTPPVWDSAAGIFPPAIFLYENNFDFSSLLEQGGYLAAGSNVHSFSAMTYIVYGAMKHFDGDPQRYIPFLHIMQIILSAMVVAATFLVTKLAAGTRPALAACLILMATPVYLVQTSYIYMEIPGALTLLLSLLCWHFKRPYAAMIMAAVSLSIKAFGVVACISLITLMWLECTRANRTKTLIFTLLTLAAIVAYALLISSMSDVDSGSKTQITYGRYLYSLSINLLYVPDLLAWVVLGTLAIVGMLAKLKPRTLLIDINEQINSDMQYRIRAGLMVFAGMFLLFMLTIYFSGSKFFPLTRYYVWALPMLICLSVCALQWLTIKFFSGLNHANGRAQAIVSTAFILILVGYLSLNLDGRYYPQNKRYKNSFSRVERSFEYKKYYEFQRDIVTYLATYHSDETIFLTRVEYYLMSSPLMGYIPGPVGDTRFILAGKYRRANLSQYPDTFLVANASSNRYHGQAALRRVLKRAREQPNYQVKMIRKFKSPPYLGAVYRISRQPESTGL